MATKKKKINSNLIFVIISIVIVLLIYFGINILKFFAHPADTVIIRNGELINSEDTVGYIIRNEKLVDTSNYSGTPSIQVADNNRVAKEGTIVAYSSSIEQNYIDKIKELDNQIQKALNERISGLSNDERVLEEGIEELIFDSRREKNNTYVLAEYKKEINEKINKKAKIVGDLSPAGSKIKSLIAERNSYEAKINDAKKELKAEEAGLVSYRVDNLENILTEDSISSLSIGSLENLKLNTDKLIAMDTDKIKIVDNFECYVAVPMYSEDSKNASLNDKVYLRFDNMDDYYITGTIEYISEEDEGRLIVFKITTDIESLTKYRKVGLEVAWWKYKGLKVPNSSIVEKYIETKSGEKVTLSTLLVQKTSYTDEVWVKILRKAKEFSIIENYTDTELIEMGLSDNLIENRKTIKMYDEILIDL